MAPRSEQSVVVVLLALVALFFAGPASAQPPASETKRQEIEAEIAAAHAQKKAGIARLAVGVGASLLSLLVVPKTTDVTCDPITLTCEENEEGSAVLFWGLLGIGSVLEIWGLYDWVDGAQTERELKIKKYDLSLRPYVPRTGTGPVNLALEFRAAF